jgi:hypothetical protein
MNVCVLDAARTCVGCRRTIDEIANWGRMTAADQWRVVDRLARLREQAGAAAAEPAGAN